MMHAEPRSPADFWSGLLFAGLGTGFALASLAYDRGSATRMGPGFFPFAMALALFLLGLAAALRSFLRAGPAIEALSFRPIVLVLGATLCFGILLEGAGLTAALVVTVLVSARAGHSFRWSSAILLAGAVSALSVLLFCFALGLPIPVVGRWITG